MNMRKPGRPSLAEAPRPASVVVVFRCTPEQKAAWAAAGGAVWLRKLLQRRVEAS